MKEGSTSGVNRFEASCAFTFVAARRLAHHPRDGFVDRLSGFGFPPPYYPSYRALASTLVSLSSLNAPAFAGHTFMPVYPGAQTSPFHSKWLGRDFEPYRLSS
jgi:hypothetical protein